MGVKTPNAFWQSTAPSTDVLLCSFGAIWFLLQGHPNLHSWIIPILASQFKEQETLEPSETGSSEKQFGDGSAPVCSAKSRGRAAACCWCHWRETTARESEQWSLKCLIRTWGSCHLSTIRIDFQLFLFPTTGVGLVLETTSIQKCCSVTEMGLC